MESNGVIYIQLPESDITEEEQEVIKYTQMFLNSDKKDIMEHCFESIRDNNNERVFRNTIKEINDDLFDSLFLLVSNVLLTANKVECDSLNYIVSTISETELLRRKHFLKIIPGYNVGAADAYLFKYNRYYILHINAYETGSSTPGGSSDIVRFISNHPLLRPSSIISFGVCYGRTPSTQSIGDVIIPEKLYPWSIGQKIIDKQLVIKHDNFNLWLYDLFNDGDLYTTLKDFCNDEDGRTINGSVELMDGGNAKEYFFSVRTMMGDLSTGEAVVSSQDAKRVIPEANHNYKELGGEMEGYGIAKECVYYAHIPCFIIKSICDWGVLKNITPYIIESECVVPKFLKDKLQAYACFCAGIVLIKLLEKEKDKIVTLQIIDDISRCGKGRDFLKGNLFYKKEEIINWIVHYYRIDESYAENLFNLLIDTEIITKTSNLRAKLYKYCLKEN